MIFICVFHKYASDGTIVEIIIDRLNIDNNFRETFWECYKHVVRKTLEQYINLVHSTLEGKCIGKFKFII